MTNSASGTYSDVSGVRFGRLPDDLTNTFADSGNAMLLNWTGTCQINNGSNPWFRDNWREIVFYSIADGHKPVDPLLPGNCGSCITINFAGSSKTDRTFVVLVAGRSLPTQGRTTPAEKGSIANYLEGENVTPLDDLFESKSPTGTFNDRVRYFPD
jgi:hypothetical protein